ncbi:hypothetical protein Jann_3547 [Jannaschia sp. CCS1]|nr:hypothetical protein Jann_3547 [Jannaschia sp. CCS1]
MSTTCYSQFREARALKQYMVIERFKGGCSDAAYERLSTIGWLLPEGLNYLNSWVNRERNICYQLMESNSPDLFDLWFSKWSDLVEFELVPLD